MCLRAITFIFREWGDHNTAWFTRSLRQGDIRKKTSQELGNCPLGQREALLKERIYWKKGFIERKALLKKKKIGKNLEILLKLWNLVKIVKFGWNCEI